LTRTVSTVRRFSSFFFDEGLARRVVGDPNRLRQVLLNLGTNAVKFTPLGAVAIRVEGVEGSRSTVRFSVKDTGIGIPAAARERIFEAFYQVDASTTRRHGGTGLGLAIVRQLVGLMNGRVEVDSEEGGGSTFSFTADLPPVAEERSPATVRPEALEGLRVLVVDDNATNRLVLREMLRAWKCVPEEAVDAWEGLEKLRAAAGGPEAFQLALVDFQMPEMDGGQLATEVKADPRLASLPLILLTSMPQHGEAARMMGLGFAAYLTKPVRQSLLLETIAAVIGAPSPASRPSPLSLVRRQEP
jgi:CheY-like chemotaxis protein